MVVVVMVMVGQSHGAVSSSTLPKWMSSMFCMGCSEGDKRVELVVVSNEFNRKLLAAETPQDVIDDVFARAHVADITREEIAGLQANRRAGRQAVGKALEKDLMMPVNGGIEALQGVTSKVPLV